MGQRVISREEYGDRVKRGELKLGPTVLQETAQANADAAAELPSDSARETTLSP